MDLPSATPKTATPAKANPGGAQQSSSDASAATTLRDYTYTTVFLPEPGGGYTVFVPALPEVCGTGITLAEAELAARESIALALEVRREMGDPFPADSRDIPIVELRVALADIPA